MKIFFLWATWAVPLCLVLLTVTTPGAAQTLDSNFLEIAKNASSGQNYSLSLQTLLLLSSLSFLPTVLLMMSSFTRIVVVLSFLRQAIGTPTVPSNQVVIGLALFLTYFVMSPVLQTIYVEAYQPFSEERISMQTAIEKGAEPLKVFMLKQTREDDLAMFLRLSKTESVYKPEDTPMSVLIPSFVTSELKQLC